MKRLIVTLIVLDYTRVCIQQIRAGMKKRELDLTNLRVQTDKEIKAIELAAATVSARIAEGKYGSAKEMSDDYQFEIIANLA